MKRRSIVLAVVCAAMITTAGAADDPSGTPIAVDLSAVSLTSNQCIWKGTAHGSCASICGLGPNTRYTVEITLAPREKPGVGSGKVRVFLNTARAMNDDNMPDAITSSSGTLVKKFSVPADNLGCLSVDIWDKNKSGPVVSGLAVKPLSDANASGSGSEESLDETSQPEPPVPLNQSTDEQYAGSTRPAPVQSPAPQATPSPASKPVPRE